MNVIIRNLTFLDTADCFPEWSPNDGPAGNWNSAYDSISIRNATHVWIDHNRFADLRTARRHAAGLISGGATRCTTVSSTSPTNRTTSRVSWNQFADHDKAMLIGNSDGALADRGKLRVTLHHNLFENIGQRAPRVRFGKVHVYNNVYRVDGDANYHSSWGAGVESQIYAENNYFEMSASFGPMEVIDGKKGTRITTTRQLLAREERRANPLDFVAAWNAKFDPDLSPRCRLDADPVWCRAWRRSTAEARERVLNEAGRGSCKSGRKSGQVDLLTMRRWRQVRAE